MGRFVGSRSLVIIGTALVVLLAALAALQYRWSTRVAAADAQREKEHLDSAGSLLAREFNAAAGEAALFIQNNARAALDSGERLRGLPRLIGELYYFDASAQGAPKVRRLEEGGLFLPATTPEWIITHRCSAFAFEQPPALVVPVYEIATEESRDATGIRVRKKITWQQERCFIAPFDGSYLRDTLFPQLIQRSFGTMAAREYEFAVIPRDRPREALYGSLVRADLRLPFFSRIDLPTLPKPPPVADGQSRQTMVYQRVERVTGDGRERLPDPSDAGMWELDVAHKDMPLTAAFERKRQLDLLLGLGLESLLVAVIVLLVIGVRGVERLADQKMRFVAGVSHELRSPVSAISMLSRNQADGLVAGADKVRQYGELIHQQSRRLNEMVEHALQYAGIHSAPRRPANDEVDLCRVVEETLEERREALDRAGFVVEIAVSPDFPPVMGDARLLRMALDNLIGNAQRHADSGRWIRVAASYSASEKQVHISVEDQGPGIEPADRAEIFEPFFRGRAASEAQIPGSGLGLSLVRSAAEAHRGSSTLMSGPGRGSTFTVHLPV
jgi:signal transduction histidine kinase